MARAGRNRDDDSATGRGRRSFLRTGGLVVASFGPVPTVLGGVPSQSDRLTPAWRRSITRDDEFLGMKAGDGFLVALRAGRIDGFERATGKRVWHHPTRSTTYDAAIHGTRLHVQNDQQVRALSGTGEGIWSYDHGGTRDVTMAFQGPRGFFGCRQELSAVTVADGTVEWTVAAGPTVPRATMDDALVVVQPSEVTADTYGVRDPATGRARWTYRPTQSTSTTAFVGVQHLFVHDGSQLVALPLADVSQNWTIEYGPSPPDSVVERGGLVSVADDGTVRTFDATSGRQRWTLDLASGATPLAHTDSLIFYATYSRLFAVDSTGTLAYTRELTTRTRRQAFATRGTPVDDDLLLANGPAIEILNDAGEVLDAVDLDGSAFSLAVDRDAVFTLAGSTLYAIARDETIERATPKSTPTRTPERTPTPTETPTPTRSPEPTPTSTATVTETSTTSKTSGENSTGTGDGVLPPDFGTLALLVTGGLGLAYLLRNHKRRDEE